MSDSASVSVWRRNAMGMHARSAAGRVKEMPYHVSRPMERGAPPAAMAAVVLAVLSRRGRWGMLLAVAVCEADLVTDGDGDPEPVALRDSERLALTLALGEGVCEGSARDADWVGVDVAEGDRDEVLLVEGVLEPDSDGVLDWVGVAVGDGAHARRSIFRLMPGYVESCWYEAPPSVETIDASGRA